MNEKRNIQLEQPALDPDSPETRTRSDVAPKQKQESGAPARHISGLRPAVHLPAAPFMSVDVGHMARPAARVGKYDAAVTWAAKDSFGLVGVAQTRA